MGKYPLVNPALKTPALLTLLLVSSLLLSAIYGAVPISLPEMFSALRHYVSAPENLTLNERIFMFIRLPRALLCVLVGAGLAAGGTMMQGLFRNPIVEPGLVGTSSGAAFGAALYFVLGGVLHWNAGAWTLPLAACAGGLLATALVFGLAETGHGSNRSVVTLLLTGVAINALFMSGVGFLSYIARDPQARSITFWGLGSLAGANWYSVSIVGTTTLLCVLAGWRYAKHLNTLMLGEQEAHLLGVEVQHLKMMLLFINVVMVAVATAFVGVISFVGLVVPHLLRITSGSDHRSLIRNSVLLGGTLLSIADLAARMLLRPAELPIGIVTSLVGVPVFIILLRQKKYYF